MAFVMRNRSKSSGQPAGVSPVWGDARVPGSEAPLGAWSGCGGTSRRTGRGTVRWLSWELGRPSSARSLRGIGAASVYKRQNRRGGSPKPRSAGLGQLLPPRQLRAEVRADRRLRARTPRDPRLQQARALRPQMGQPLRRRLVRALGCPHPSKAPSTTGRRMPRDERCRRAVGGRTARSDRCGGGRRQAASRQARAAR